MTCTGNMRLRAAKRGLGMVYSLKWLKCHVKKFVQTCCDCGEGLKSFLSSRTGNRDLSSLGI